MLHIIVLMLAAGVAALLLGATLHDIATRTVPNGIAGAVAALGVGLRLADGDLVTGFGVAAVMLFATGLLWWRGWLGGADAKLAAAVSLALPPSAVGEFLLVLTLAGGGIALVYLALSFLIPRPTPGRRRSFFGRILKAEAWRLRRRGPLPYAAAIAAGGLYSLLPLIAG